MTEIKEKPKRKRLTKKQHGFVKDYLKTGVATTAVMNNYDVATYETAAVMANENLNKPNVKSAIEDALSDEKLRQAHEELLNQARFEYFVFPKVMSDEEITEKVEAVGVTLVVIQAGEKGKYAFYKTVDAHARKSALDMAYKLKGSYAPDKSINLNVEVEASDKVKEVAKQLNEFYRTRRTDLSGGNGNVTSPVGGEALNQERIGPTD